MSWVGRRKAERKTSSLKAQARFYDGSPPLDCIVTDFSASGARIELPDGRDCPTAFDLHVPSRGDTRHAVLRWQTPEAIGVEFTAAKASGEDVRLSELLMRVGRLEEEMRAARADALVREAARDIGASAERPSVADGETLAELSHRLTALEATRDDMAAMARRVAKLEARNDDILQALRQALQLLGDLRGPAPLAKTG